MPDGPGPGGFRAALNRLPLPVLFVLLVVLWVGLQTVFRIADRPLSVLGIAVEVAAGCVVAGFATWRVAVARRNLGGADEVWAFARSVRTGEVPPGVDRDGWRAQIAWQRRRIRRFHVLTVPLAVPVVAVGLWAALAVPHARVVGWLIVGLFVALIVASLLSVARLKRRLDRLEANLAD